MRTTKLFVAALLALAAGAQAQDPAALADCDAPVSDIDPSADPVAWRLRDLHNIRCSRQHSEDQLANPAFLVRHALLAGPQFLENVAEQILEPDRVHANPVFFAPGARAADPFREPGAWERSGRGQTQEVSFIARNGAKIVARLYAPPPSDPQPKLPAVTITPGLQSYNEVYEWAAEGLAEAGYIVLVIDPQGQGRSENFPHEDDRSIACLPQCDNVPTNTQPETRDAIDFLLSTEDEPWIGEPTANSEGTNLWNPLAELVDAERIGIAGHSLGASAVSNVGQTDPRVKAIVAFDALRTVEAPVHVPALSLAGDYPFPLPNGVPADPESPPDPDSKAAAFDQLRGAGVDVMLVVLRAATHYEWSYLPFLSGQALVASRYGERVSMHYTLAWFDRHLKDDPTALSRLVAVEFDDSADRSSIGQGIFDPATLNNVPYEIEGQCVANRLSFYYRSKYSFRTESGELFENDLRSRGCGG